MNADERVPFRRAWEPSKRLRRVLQLLYLPPFLLVGLPLNAVWNLGTYVVRRPAFGFVRHMMSGLLRFALGWAGMGCVYPADPEANKVPTLALKKYTDKAEMGVREIPPVAEEVPRLPIFSLTPAMKQVKPVPVPLFAAAPKGTPDLWARAAPGELALFYLVGGGWQTGHPLRFPLATSWVEHTQLRLFAPNYRKALDDASAFPAVLYDILAGWHYVVHTLGFEPSNVLLIGDSAGGHSVLLLARYLEEMVHAGYTSLGLPGGVFSMSPPTNMLWNFPSYNANYHKDWVQSVKPVIAGAFLRHAAGHLTNPYLSPGLTPASDGHYARLAAAGVLVYVNCGTDEGLYDDGTHVVAAMREQGLDATLREFEGGVHCEYALAGLPFPLWRGAGWTWPILLDDLDKIIATMRARKAAKA